MNLIHSSCNNKVKRLVELLHPLNKGNNFHSFLLYNVSLALWSNHCPINSYTENINIFFFVAQLGTVGGVKLGYV